MDILDSAGNASKEGNTSSPADPVEIFDVLTRDDALKVLELGASFAQESRHHGIAYDRDAVWAMLEGTVKSPSQRYIAYAKTSTGAVVGFILGFIRQEVFSGRKLACDSGIFVAPSHRGGRTFFRMVRKLEAWARDNGAYALRLEHGSGIASDQAVRLFTGIGYTHYGHLFDKELSHV